MALNQAYAAKMKPFAERAAQALSMPPEVILAQWSLESGNGTSDHASKYNNHAGIKVPAQRKFYGYKRTGTAFAGYASLDAFTNDYISNMSLSFYKNVRGADGVEGTIKALGESPWDEGHYLLNGVKGGKLLNLLGKLPAAPVPVEVPVSQSAACPHCHNPVYLRLQ